jgi:hypothetical protein
MVCRMNLQTRLGNTQIQMRTTDVLFPPFYAKEIVAPTVAQPPQTKTTPTETYRASLRKNLVEFFNDSELRDLCFDMNVDYESLNGQNKADKARELVAFCERRQVIADLVARCRKLRPKVEWEGEYE